MINRIQDIKNIGTFADTHPASIELSKLVLIYGPNSQGKTTLCDVVKSLKLQDAHYITERKTVGQIAPQIVSFNFSNGKTAKFQNGAWQLSDGISDVSKIEIFDTAFVFDNVFTNNVIEHKNKENFTRFIIGEDSIALSRELTRLNEQKNTLSRQLDAVIETIETVLQGKIDLKQFIKLPFQSDIHDEDVALLGLQTNIKDEENNRKNIVTIKNLVFPTVLPLVDTTVFNIYDVINDTLASNYSFQKQDLLQLYTQHKTKCINDSNNSTMDNWLLQGTKWIKDDKCPFCGTSLTDNESIDVFLEFFSKEIQDYNAAVLSLRSQKKLSKIHSVTTKLIQNEELLGKINAKVYNEEANDLFYKLISLKEEIIKAYEDIGHLTSFIAVHLRTSLFHASFPYISDRD